VGLHVINDLTGYGFFWIFLLLLCLQQGLAGLPAIYVSSFSPQVFLETFGLQGSGRLSPFFLHFNSISITALAMGLVFAKNADYQRTLDLGYDRDKVLVLPIPPEKYASFRTEFRSDPRVISVAGTQNHIGYGSYRRPIKDVEKQLEVDVMDIGPDYAQTMGLRLVEGRFFDELRESADRENGSIIVNQKLLSDFGWSEGTGKVVTLYDTTKLTVIGVVKDFYLGGVWEEIEPAMLRLARNDNYYTLAIRANPADQPDVLEFMRTTWKSLSRTASTEEGTGK
jgi:hypothetical protein